ncbi:MAG: sigma 54-interacting transcriptional regulator [Desulfobulbaceae bacterium]|nr:sigma 54-interacting transcriptional regulator [Desulfobulbaceae bacterium]
MDSNEIKSENSITENNSPILVVDDEESLRLTFKMFLSRAGYGPVSSASSYDEALELLKTQKFDLIVSDIVMEGSSGIDLLRQVKELGLKCPMVMVTGYPNINSAAEAVRLGAFDYLAKPVKKDNLLRTARMALQQYNLHKENEKLILEKDRYQQYLETVFRSIKDLVVTVDSEMIIIDMNNEAKKWLKKLSPEAQAHADGRIDELPCFSEIFAFDAQTVLREENEVAEHRVEFEMEGHGVTVFRVSAAPLLTSDGYFLGVVLVARDVSRLEALEQRDVRTGLHRLVGNSRPMQTVYTLVENVGKVDTTILITGESGTGKELVAEALHLESPRRDMPMVKVDCTAIPENLLESELFGHKKGSFTGADRDRQGRILQADGGTLFLDEIGDISSMMQLRLLRFLQERTFYPVGEDRPIKVDVRVITATNADLKSQVVAGNFREDLYYRLKVVDIVLPPLRERSDDIPLLVKKFIERFSKRLDKSIHGISDQALGQLIKYRWPGNVRELEHVVERACVLCSGMTITQSNLPLEIQDQENVPSQPESNSPYSHQAELESGNENEEERIINTLKLTYGNKAQAARILGIDRSTLYRKLRQFDIDADNLL